MREGALDLTQALDFSCQICNAVDHAHRAGILHRDLRPGNMLVSEYGMLKVTDFGTSRFLEIAAHGTTVIGSPPYMAPEQFHGKAVFASDVYSVGVTMYQMLTGSLPYDTPAPADLARLSRGELVTAPRIKNPKIPKAINDIVLRALAPDPTARYQRAADMLNDLLAARAPPPRRAVRAGARDRRRQRLRHSVPPESARNAAGQFLLALPQTSSGADGQMSVLRRNHSRQRDSIQLARLVQILLLSMPDSFEHTPHAGGAHAERRARVAGRQRRSRTTASPSPI